MRTLLGVPGAQEWPHPWPGDQRDRKKGWQAGRQAGRHTHTLYLSLTHTRTGVHAKIHIHAQTHIHTNTHTHKHTNTHTHKRTHSISIFVIQEMYIVGIRLSAELSIQGFNT